MIRAGEFNRRIACDEPVTTQSANGEELVAFVESFKTFAKIQPLTGRERLQSNEITAEMDTRIRIRWTPTTDGINAKWRLRYLGTIYNISSVAIINMGMREIEIMARSGLNTG